MADTDKKTDQNTEIELQVNAEQKPKRKNTDTPVFEASSNSNPITSWTIHMKEKYNERKKRKKLEEREKKRNEVPFIPRVWGWGGFVDFWIGLKIIIWGNKISFLCLAIPFAFVSNQIWGAVPTFVLCMLSIIPLAKLLGEATEQLSLRVGQTVGGLLNATFGNAVELIVSIVALSKGLLRIVQTSLLGSILSNILLVLGMSFFAGGMFFKVQHFNQTGAQTSASLLTLAVIAILFPAAFSLTSTTSSARLEEAVLQLSRISAIVLLIVYVTYLIFQLKTHTDMFEEAPTNAKEKKEEKEEKEKKEKKEKKEGEEEEDEEGEEEEDEEETPLLSIWGAILLLAVVTVLVAILADDLVGSIEEVTQTWGVSDTFVGIILLPIVGNAAEHVTAVSVAMKDKMDLTIGVAMGSSIQIALLVIPLLVILGWIIGQPLTLYFLGFETVVLFISVIIVNGCVSDGESNYLEGLLLMATYFILATAFFFSNEETLISNAPGILIT